MLWSLVVVASCCEDVFPQQWLGGLSDTSLRKTCLKMLRTLHCLGEEKKKGTKLYFSSFRMWYPKEYIFCFLSSREHSAPLLFCCTFQLGVWDVNEDRTQSEPPGNERFFSTGSCSSWSLRRVRSCVWWRLVMELNILRVRRFPSTVPGFSTTGDLRLCVCK